MRIATIPEQSHREGLPNTEDCVFHQRLLYVSLDVIIM